VEWVRRISGGLVKGVRRSRTFDEQWLGTTSRLVLSAVAFCSSFWFSESSCYVLVCSGLLFSRPLSTH